MEAKMRPSTIAAIWIGGGILAVLAYAVGPDRFVGLVWDTLANLDATLSDLVAGLATVGFDLLRAAAIGLFIVFTLLCLIAIRRGLRGWMALIVVSVVFMVAVEAGPAGPSRGGWLLAFCLALAGAVSMTGRLLRSEGARR